jgi:hypothetical protein
MSRFSRCVRSNHRFAVGEQVLPPGESLAVRFVPPLGIVDLRSYLPGSPFIFHAEEQVLVFREAVLVHIGAVHRLGCTAQHFVPLHQLFLGLFPGGDID